MSDIGNHLSLLSKREKEVYGLLFTPLSRKEISKELFITEGAVKFHLTNIYKKLKVKSRSELIGSLIEQKKSNPI